jgi:ketosteroid isomerase-like protein
MKRGNLLPCFWILILLLATTLSYSQSDAEYKTKIETMNKQMAKDMLAGNTEKLLSLYTSDAISLPNYQPIHEGIAAIRKASEEDAKSGVKITSFEPTTLKVMANGNLITEIGTYKIDMTMPGMDKPMMDHGKYLTVWEKQKDGSLKIKIETWNSDINPANMDQSTMEKKK